MPKSPLARLLLLCGVARLARVPLQFRLSGAAWLCILIDVGAAHAATNPSDGDWYVAISCEQSGHARAFSFREQVRISGGEFALTHHGTNFVHEFSGSIKDDRVRITGVGRNNTVSSDRSWRFSGRSDGSREVRIKGTMNGRDTGATFYQDCEVFMSALNTTAAAKADPQPAAVESDNGLRTRVWPQSGGAPQPHPATAAEVAADSQPSASESQSAPAQASQAQPQPAAAPRGQAMQGAPSAPIGAATTSGRPNVIASPMPPSGQKKGAAQSTNPPAAESSRRSASEPSKPTAKQTAPSFFKSGDFWSDRSTDSKATQQ